MDLTRLTGLKYIIAMNWIDVLQAERLPLNCQISFHCHNEGVRRAVYKGVQVPLSKAAKQFVWEWINSNRVESFIVDTSTLDGYDWKRAVEVKVSFVNGEPPGDPAFGGRKDRKRILKSIWGNTEHWRDNG